MPKLNLDRATLAKLLQGNARAIAAFEQVLGDVGFTLPSTIEEANALAGQALAVAQVAMASLSVLAEALAQLECAPAAPPQVEADDHAPRAHLGTISAQNHDAVEITGGTTGLDAGAAPLPSLYLGGDRTTGIYRSGLNTIGIAIAGGKLLNLMAQMLEVTGKITVTDQITSTLATGTAPLVVGSTTKVANLYVDRAALADNATTATSATSAGTLTNPTALPAAATDLPTVIALANALRGAAQSKGL